MHELNLTYMVKIFQGALPGFWNEQKDHDVGNDIQTTGQSVKIHKIGCELRIYLRVKCQRAHRVESREQGGECDR